VAVHIYTQTIHRTTQITTNVEECGPCPVFASFTLAFALQLRKKYGKLSVRVRKTSVRLSKTCQSTVHILLKHPHKTKHTQKPHIITPPPHTHTHITKQYKTTTVQMKTKNPTALDRKALPRV
jgi:hypothetical protein